MAHTKVTPRGGQVKAHQVKSRAQGQMKMTQPEEHVAEEAPTTVHIHAAAELERRREEVRKLKEVGRSPELSPNQQLAQMDVEAGPLMLVGEEPA